MRALFRHLFLALTIAALIPPALVACMPPAAVAAAMPGRCARCEVDNHAPARMPICGIPACSAAAIMAQTPVTPATLLVSRAAYAAGPVTPLMGVAPKTDPPPPRSFLAL